MTEDRHGNPAGKVTIRHWYRKGTMTLVARQYDNSEIQFAPEPLATPIARGGKLGWAQVSRKP